MVEPIEEEPKLPARVASGIPQNGIMGVGKLAKETVAPSVTGVTLPSPTV